jgi:hypothetical protein
MLGSLIRNYKNTGVRVNVSLCVQQSPADKSFPPVFVHGATGLEIHNLATAAHRELMRQARGSALPRRPGERFEDLAWKVATFSLIKSLPELRHKPAASVGMVIPYSCFLAEYLSLNWRDGEERDVCISASGEVFINALAPGLHTDAKTLDRYEA